MAGIAYTGVSTSAAQPAVTPAQPSTPPAAQYLTGSPYGTAIPDLFGRCELDGVPLWSGPIKSTVQSDGTTAQTVSFAVAFGRPSPLSTSAKLKRLYINGTLVVDNTVTPRVIAPGLVHRFHAGSETQNRDQAIVKVQGKNNTPAFRGLMYVVIEDYPLTWTGGIYPVVSADISQVATNKHLVEQWAQGNTQSYSSIYIDWPSNLAYFFGSTGSPWIDVYNMVTKSFIKRLTISQARFDFMLCFPYNYGPYFVLADQHVNNTNPIYLVSKTTGAIVSQVIDVFPQFTFAAKGVGDIDEFIVMGAFIFGGFKVYARKSTQLIVYPAVSDGPKITCGVYADVPGINVNDSPVLGKVSPPYDHNSPASTNVVPGADAYPVPANTDNFSVAYVASQFVGIKRVIFGKTPGTSKQYTPTNDLAADALPVLNRLDADFNTAPLAVPGTDPSTWSTVGRYERKQFSFCLVEGTETVIPLASTLVVATLFTGPKTNPYLSMFLVDVTDDSNHICSLRVYTTPWNATLPNVQDLAFNNVTGTPTGTEYTRPTAADISGAYVKIVDVPLPKFFTTGTPIRSMLQREPGSDWTSFFAFELNQMYIVNVFTGEIIVYTASDAVYARVDGQVLPAFHFSGFNLYMASKNALIFPEDIAGSPDPSPPTSWPGLIYLDGSEEHGYTVQTYITELCLSAGLTSGQLQFVNVSDTTIIGGILNTTVKLVDILSQLCELFRIDLVESAGKLKFVGKTANTVTPVRTFVQDDLAFITQNGLNDNNVLANSMASTSNLPAILFLDYLDFDNHCLIGTQSVRRTKFPVPTTASIATLTLSVPVVMNATDAAFWITRCIYDLWAGQLTNGFLIGVRDIKLEPGDYISITLDDGTVYTIKISDTTLNGDFSISATGSTVSEAVTFAKPSVDSATTSTKRLVAGSTFSALPIHNLLLFASDNAGDGNFPYYWVASGQATLTENGVAIGSLDNAPSIGTAASQLLPRGAAVHQVDDDTVLFVSFPSGSPIIPFIDTDAAFLDGSNACLVSVGTNWELVYYRYLAQSATGVAIHHLARGQRGTDVFADGHAIGDTVVFFTQDSLSKLAIGTDSLNTPITLTALPKAGGAVSQAIASTTFMSMGGPLRPLAPMNLTATRDHVTLDIAFTWQRRSRISGGLHDGDGSQTLDEASEEYTLSVKNDDGTQTFRSFGNIPTETVTYTAAQQTADGFSTAATSIRAAVAQISAAVGQGYMRETTCQITLT